MEFTKLSEVEVVETATDNDKVLIEQNGEIKRVPKTEVGGSGGNALIITADNFADPTIAEPTSWTANMTLTEALEAFRNGELTGPAIYMSTDGAQMSSSVTLFGDFSSMLGVDCLAVMCMQPQLELYWTADGISTEPPATASE